MGAWVVVVGWEVVGTVLAAGLGALLGARVRPVLRSGAHRRPTDGDHPLPRLAWLPVVCAVGLAVPAAVRLATGEPDPERADPVGALLWVGCVVAGSVASAIDLDVHRLPDRLTLPAAAGAAVGVLLLGGVTGEWGAAGRAVVAGLVLYGALWVLALLTAGGIGLGDAKLGLATGLVCGWFGWQAVLLGTWVAFGLGAAWALLLITNRRASRGTHLAFGPPMVVGAWGLCVLGLAAG